MIRILTAPLLSSAFVLAYVTPAAAQEVVQDHEVVQTPEHDPLAGMDADGRIERPPMPSDLKNPGRWRYTPPGRIPPGNPLERFFISSFLSPILFRDEDIGFGGGIALTDIDFRNKDYQEFANILLTYSEEGQQRYAIGWRRWLNHRKLSNGGIIREERSSLFGRAGYSKTLTRRFFGFGSRTEEEDETSYTEELSEFAVSAQVSLPDPGDDVIGYAGLIFESHGLSGGRISNVPSTEQVFADTVEAGDELDQMWLEAAIAYDSRDSISQPYSGWRTGLSTQTALLQTGGDVGGVVALDAQVVVPVPPLLHSGGDGTEENPPTDVLAVGAFVADTWGDLPFYRLPNLGGSNTLRGFIDNRFTDRAAWHASVEWRLALVPRGIAFTKGFRFERIGLALFHDMGTVASGIDDLSDGRVHTSSGLGLRFAFAREALFRLDYGFSDEGTNLVIRFGNAF